LAITGISGAFSTATHLDNRPVGTVFHVTVLFEAMGNTTNERVRKRRAALRRAGLRPIQKGTGYAEPILC
jgi:hypothetical protein